MVFTCRYDFNWSNDGYLRVWSAVSDDGLRELAMFYLDR